MSQLHDTGIVRVPVPKKEEGILCNIVTQSVEDDVRHHEEKLKDNHPNPEKECELKGAELEREAEKKKKKKEKQMRKKKKAIEDAAQLKKERELKEAEKKKKKEKQKEKQMRKKNKAIEDAAQLKKERELKEAELETRDILLLGEGNFSFAVAFCTKHPELCSQVVATDICVRRETGANAKVTASNIKYLEEQEVLVGVLDASCLPSGCKFSWVQFNCPCGDDAMPIPEVVDRLFAWCQMGLTTGGKIHISCHGNQQRAQWKLRLPSIQKKYGFELYEVNKTLLHRYPGYAPTRTNGGAFKDRSKRAVSEYIFHIGEAGVRYTTHGRTYTIEPSGSAATETDERGPKNILTRKSKKDNTTGESRRPQCQPAEVTVVAKKSSRPLTCGTPLPPWSQPFYFHLLEYV